MFGPYWMAFFNLISFILVILGTVAYRFLYPKKKLNYLILLLVLSLLPVISIFRIGVYESGDFTQAIYRSMAFTDNLKLGIPIPSWAADLNGGYGYPVFIFIYLVPYYLISLLHLLGFSFILSGKLLFAFSYIFSGIFMFFLLRKMFKNDLAAFSGSIIYLFTPYHLVDLHFRVALAEIIAFVLPPIILFLILKLKETEKLIFILLIGLLFGLFFLTHPAQFIFYSGLFFIYLFFQKLIVKENNLQTIIKVIISFLIGLAISSFAWLPRFTLTQFTYGSLLIKTPVIFLKPLELLYAPWRLGFLFQGHKGELSFLIGYTQIILILFSIYFLFKQKNNKELLFWTLTSIILIFLMLPYSKFIWSVFPLLNLMQFSYRLLHPFVFCLSIITAYLVIKYKKRETIIFIFLILTIGYTLLNWGHRNMIPSIDDNWLRKNITYSTRQGEGVVEADPIWWNIKNGLWISQNPKTHLQIIQGRGQIKELSRNSVSHEYIIYSAQNTTILENTFYFPGWSVKVDSKPVKINYKMPNFPARMVFNVPGGIHYIQVRYSDIPIIQYAKILSLSIIFLISVYSIFYLIKYIIKILPKNFNGKQKK